MRLSLLGTTEVRHHRPALCTTRPHLSPGFQLEIQSPMPSLPNSCHAFLSVLMLATPLACSPKYIQPSSMQRSIYAYVLHFGAEHVRFLHGWVRGHLVPSRATPLQSTPGSAPSVTQLALVLTCNLAESDILRLGACILPEAHGRRPRRSP